MSSVKAVVFSVAVVALIVLGILNVITNYEENKCEMTWMFEQPQYLVRDAKVYVPNVDTVKSIAKPKANLYKLCGVLFIDSMDSHTSLCCYVIDVDESLSMTSVAFIMHI